ncbi:unnamed protein product [Zymoseptoria tritici ST99CH_1A5]|uniref:Uncharacterized protein n=3 Tax=Zymoseptoria tritici TaxID=1047171 RepID=A0A1X7RF32_ZYMT9|nr:unnamed protein product [Zymoseptoria tritici ST99CH_3D7]SMR42155.1 unnamed protein product [Zymoseptoria tritici ST99CH_1E4]SMR44335.1 unnamed protein product [Zymoseptoria tritici ST99CH_3D1]SMY19490.1 unnamed protein product [Zymoseptoria tritici ST99CH_1A5]
MPRGGFEAIEPFRAEVEERTRNGESLVQITEALAAKGYQCSSKTLSRYRLAWGIRQRAAGRTVGYKYPNRKRKAVGPLPKKRNSEHNKKEITERTARGETAEQIADALGAQGIVLKKGASTIWRLQTYWGLIPYDESRARGNKNRKPGAAAGESGPPAKRVRRKKKDPRPPADPTAFYPSNCQHGPQKRGPATAAGSALTNLFQVGSNPDPGSDSEQEPLPMMDDYTPPPPAASTHGDNSFSDAADLMSAEFLVDLATSTLIAAKHVRELYTARQMRAPMPGSTGNQPPTDQDLANAKQKVREAAGVMFDLALPTVAAPS